MKKYLMTLLTLGLACNAAACMEDERQLWYNLNQPANVGLSAATVRLLAYPELVSARSS